MAAFLVVAAFFAGFLAVAAFLVVAAFFAAVAFLVVVAFLAGVAFFAGAFLGAGLLAVDAIEVDALVAATAAAAVVAIAAGAIGFGAERLNHQAPTRASAPGTPYATTKVMGLGESIEIEMNCATSAITDTVANAPSTDDCQFVADQASPAAMITDSTIHPSVVPNSWIELIQA